MGSVQEQVLVELEAALRMVSKRVYAATRPSQIRGRHVDRAGYAVLYVIAERGELRLSEVATLLELDLSTVSRQFRQLEDAGLVRRRPDPLDGRASLVTLSPDGRKALAALRAHRVDLLADALCDWRAADRTELLRLLQRLTDDLASPDARTNPHPGSARAPAPGAGPRSMRAMRGTA